MGSMRAEPLAVRTQSLALTYQGRGLPRACQLARIELGRTLFWKGATGPFPTGPSTFHPSPRPMPPHWGAALSMLRAAPRIRAATARHSAADSRRGAVLLVGDMLAPGRAGAVVGDLDDCEMGHEAGRRGAVPVILAGLEEHPVAGADHLDRAAAPLREADALEDVDGLAVRVRVPGRPRAGREVDAARTDGRGT
jgi:hypothetical protein